MRWLYGIITSMDMNLSKLQEMVKDGKAWHAAVHEVSKSQFDLVTEQQHVIITYKHNHHCTFRFYGKYIRYFI